MRKNKLNFCLTAREREREREREQNNLKLFLIFKLLQLHNPYKKNPDKFLTLVIESKGLLNE
ncbi:hypothetical protein A3691_08980 [Campylobacter coli]|nr:hypothetical protein [Campylobacter coli]EAL8287818.1 hypothetical protein [Campylobacter coli]